jgi:multidrug efflux system membrane fusion protein
LCFACTSCSRLAAKTSPASTDAIPVRAVIAATKDVPLEISAVGNVEAMERVEVKSRVAGQIKRVAFADGQNITRGQLLFEIDPDTLQRQEAEQRAVLERDIAMEQQARAVAARDAASQKQSESEADIARKLGDLGVLSGQRVNQLITTNDTATASSRSDQAAIEAAAGSIKADNARLSQLQLQLSFANIVAPIAGRAGVAMVKTGNMIRDNDTTLVTLLQLAPIRIGFGVPEQILPEIQRLNALGALTVEASNGDGRVQEGHLVFIDNTVDATTGTIRLKAEYGNSDGTFWPGEFVNVRLRLRIEKERLLVPEASIQDGLDGKYVWLVRSGVAATAPVSVLRTYTPENGRELAIVANGIKTGDTVVTEGQLRLTPGARVLLLDIPRAVTITSGTSIKPGT